MIRAETLRIAALMFVSAWIGYGWRDGEAVVEAAKLKDACEVEKVQQRNGATR